MKTFLEYMEAKKKVTEAPCGQCFPWALRFQNKKGGTLIHGTVTDPETGQVYSHAWVELRGKVYDWQNYAEKGRKPIPVWEYRRAVKARDTISFDDEATALATLRTGHSGPWTKEDGTRRKPKPLAMGVKQDLG